MLTCLVDHGHSRRRKGSDCSRCSRCSDHCGRGGRPASGASAAARGEGPRRGAHGKAVDGTARLAVATAPSLPHPANCLVTLAVSRRSVAPSIGVSSSSKVGLVWSIGWFRVSTSRNDCRLGISGSAFMMIATFPVPTGDGPAGSREGNLPALCLSLQSAEARAAVSHTYRLEAQGTAILFGRRLGGPCGPGGPARCGPVWSGTTE